MSLLGRHHHRAYPRPNPPPPSSGNPNLGFRRGQTHYGANNGSSASGWCNRQSIMILMIGILFGYILLPMLLVQHLGFEDLQSLASSASNKVTLSKNTATTATTTQYTRRMVPSSPEDEAEEDQLPDSPPSDADNEEPAEAANQEEPKLQPPINANDQVTADDTDTDTDATAKKTTKKKRKSRKKTTTLTTDLNVLSDVEKRIVQDQEHLARQSIPTKTTPQIMQTAVLPDAERLKILVTGGAGFVGSHLVDKLMMLGHEVIVLDNFFTGQKKNIAHWLHHPNFSLIVHDVTEPISLEVDQIYSLACPASPPHYQYNPVKTIKTSAMGTLNMLGLAKRVKARILLASTSEIYGDPQVHPQPESYWGNVNTIGPRACYDEGKRVAETMMYSYRNQNKIDVRVARIFNTFGPRMHPNDGRVVSNFIIQALQDKKMTIYGEGKQTRSFQYVSDLVEGLYALMNGSYDLPVNLGNPDEYSVKDFCEYIHDLTKSKSQIINLPKSQDDPSQRKPDIATAKRELDWAPQVAVKDGLTKTIAYFQTVLEEAGEIIPTGPGAAKPEA